MNNKKHIINLETFRDMLHVCLRVPGQSFDELPFEAEIMEFLRNTTAYKEYYACATGVAAPKPKVSAKKKRAKAKSSSDLSKAARTKAEQLKIVLKRSRQETYISQHGGSSTDEGTEVVATACFTQNHSIIRLRNGKTPYELLHSKLHDLSFFYVFGALCYPTNDSENLGPALNEMTPGTISSGLVQQSSPSTSYVPPSRNDWNLLFQPMFDELLNPPPSIVNQASEVIAPIAEVIPPVYADSTGSPSSTTIDQDAPLLSKSHTTTKIQSSVIPQDVRDDNLDMEVAHMVNDSLIGVP
nr:integrase, catalytic region, zinc finger, CCHC-type, peptidase aspartic, catalytic [Tanacetum cinerariifolium]